LTVGCKFSWKGEEKVLRHYLETRRGNRRTNDISSLIDVLGYNAYEGMKTEAGQDVMDIIPHKMKRQLRSLREQEKVFMLTIVAGGYFLTWR
jgi:hypothetical protein